MGCNNDGKDEAIDLDILYPSVAELHQSKISDGRQASPCPFDFQWLHAGRFPGRDVVSWTALISGYDQQGHNEAALRFFSQMVQSCTKPNQFTFASALSSCASLLAFNSGKQCSIVDYLDGGICPKPIW
ncbi:hypothetical protein SUGI_0197320 [Cryptomeria japonica]|nr:hypothetical protein SUGI_0197320 [Cryptomeria japonica]